MDGREFLASLVAGGVAGLCADLTLFPLDTIKTRLQSPQGFYNAGGFRGIYAGVPSAALGSFPNAALFFVTYEYTKSVLGSSVSTKKAPLVHMIAASLGEVSTKAKISKAASAKARYGGENGSFIHLGRIGLCGERVAMLHRVLENQVACLVRVPSEVVKQRAQACPSLGTYKVFIDIVRHEGILGLYRGYGSTVKREIPFSLVQFPLWEFLKAVWSWKQNHAVDSWQAAVCGAFSGAFAAVVTTPLDVAKTRIMLAEAGSTTASGKVLPVLSNIWKMQGISGLFSGIVPRVAWISLGGFIFLGTYDKMHKMLL